ncbi:DUF2213 domain-containing protein [Lichenifustis flavocetrariae]|uniref:DUF2213 domain-containing protein n=1 Tax=Lichenifustis flavocetrariae TaxID=2949735 RepID=A0AA41YZG9_9HYPH|nr:DUF2213 domain-containing protein [Lichenifustis flavocetrariae]MCW6510974.1 DUF2213 domain-containing protein [Lichenifustis flavocetrariae]
MLIHDTATAAARTRTPEGFLRVRARIARTGIHLYRAGELGAPDSWDRDGTVRVYRPPDQVFDPDSLASFAAKPVTDDHPPVLVDAGNWKRYAVGQSGPEVTRDGEHVVTDLLITDAEAVRRAEAGAQLSNGYHADFDFTPGTTPDGEPYDAVQSNIRGNHIALVDAGRCGDSCRVGDAAVRDCGCADLTRVTIDGIAIETTAAGAEALERLKLSVEAKDGAIAALTAKVSDEAAIEARVAERAVVVDAARSVLGPGFLAAGKTTAEIRRGVVTHLLGRPVEERSDVYVAAAFDTLMALRPPGQNPLARHLAAPVRDGAGSRETALRSRDHFLNHAWKGAPTHGAL